MIDNHLHCHLASPHAARAFPLVRSCRESPVTALAVDGKRRWNSSPGRWFGLLRNLSFRDLQTTHLIELNGLHSWFDNWQRVAARDVPRPELVFDVSAFANAYEKFSVLASYPAAHP
jgi:hypothetical protein